MTTDSITDHHKNTIPHDADEESTVEQNSTEQIDVNATSDTIAANNETITQELLEGTDNNNIHSDKFLTTEKQSDSVSQDNDSNEQELIQETNSITFITKTVLQVQLEVTTKMVTPDSITVKSLTTLLQDDITKELFDIRDGNVNTNSMVVTQITNLQELLEITDENVTNITITHQYATTLLQEDLTTVH